jgi:predicted dehydrogenase
VTQRVGIVGCGFIASVHSLALQGLVGGELVDAAVTATYDADPERARRIAAPHDALVAADLEELLGHVDVVWVCTWSAAHLEIVRAAVERGCAVLCEKPLAPDLRGCEEVAALLDRVPHQVGLVLRHAPVFGRVAAEVASGRYGRPLATTLRDDQYFPIQGMYRSDWRADVRRAGGGTLLEHSIHDLDVLRWILGDPVRISAVVANRFGHAGIDDVADVRLEYPDGALATLVSVWHRILRRPSTRRLEVFCEDALLWTDDDLLGPLHVETTDATEERAGELPDWIDRLALAPELRIPVSQYAVPAKSFLDSVASGTRPSPGADVALAAHRLADAAYRSAAAGGQPVGT